VVVVVLGVVVVGLLWTFQRHLLYFPDRSAVPEAGEVLPGARDVVLHTDDGLELGAWFVPPTGGADRQVAVLYAPGNGGNREGRAGVAGELADRGFGVLLMDYRGYGGNPGSPSEDGLAHDARAALRALGEQGYPPERTIYVGESLGTGVVARLQEAHPPAGVVLRSPFTDLAEAGAHHYPGFLVRSLLRDRFPVVEHLSASEVPVTVVYATADTVVPPALSATVADSVGNLVEVVRVEGANHNDPELFGPVLADAVARLADSVVDGSR
jgi:pimeloyl-ACP methyl ester carboxylesterase